MLSDGQIRHALKQGWIKLDPYPEDKDIQPASIDVHLGNRFGGLKPIRGAIHLNRPSEVLWMTGKELILHPHEFALAHIKERLTLKANFVARIEGKSSIGRRGIAIHVTAGFVDPGWDGNLTIELFNASQQTYILCEGDAIGQLAFDRLTAASLRPYGHKELGSHYQGATEAQSARHD